MVHLFKKHYAVLLIHRYAVPLPRWGRLIDTRLKQAETDKSMLQKIYHKSNSYWINGGYF